MWAESRIQDSMISKPITIVFMITVEQLIVEINKLVSTVNLMWFILYKSLIKVQQSNFRQHPLLARVRLTLGARFEQRCKERRKNDRNPNKRESKDYSKFFFVGNVFFFFFSDIKVSILKQRKFVDILVKAKKGLLRVAQLCLYFKH